MYMVLDGSWSLNVSKLGAETRDDIPDTDALGKKA